MRLWVAVVTLLSLAACSEATPAASRPTTTPSSTPTPTPSPTAAPPTASGPLSIDAFPTPDQLGAGWEHRVDPGDVEGGYVGNGTPGLERDPAEVTALAVPLGCPRDAALLEPPHAFEVDYAFEGMPVVAVRLAFETAADSAAFLRARSQNLQACLGLSGGPAVGPYVSQVRGPLNDRTPDSEPWTELVVRVGSGVLLMAAPVALGAAPFDDAGVRRIKRLVTR